MTKMKQKFTELQQISLYQSHPDRYFRWKAEGFAFKDSSDFKNTFMGHKAVPDGFYVCADGTQIMFSSRDYQNV